MRLTQNRPSHVDMVWHFIKGEVHLDTNGWEQTGIWPVSGRAKQMVKPALAGIDESKRVGAPGLNLQPDVHRGAGRDRLRWPCPGHRRPGLDRHADACSIGFGRSGAGAPRTGYRPRMEQAESAYSRRAYVCAASPHRSH